MIKIFCKYRPILNREQLNFSLDLILKNKLFLAPIEHFSDPFDAFQKNNDELKHYKSISLSENFDNRLLWAYYCGWYKGVMVEISLDTSFYPFNLLKKVEYINEDDIIRNRITKKDYYVKHSDFSHEKEWRLILKTDNKFIISPEYSIKSVTLGPALNEDYKTVIQEKCIENEISLYEYSYENMIPMLEEKTLANNGYKK